MTVDPIFLLYGAVFLGVLLLLEGLYYLFGDSQAGRENANRRMKMLASGASSQDVFKKLRREIRQRGTSHDPVSWVYHSVDRLVTQSGLRISTSRMFLLMATLSVGSWFAVFMITSRTAWFASALPITILAAGIALIVGVLFPLLYLKSSRAQRLKKFAEQLPDALDVMVRSLRAGHPVATAVTLVSVEMPDPLGTEFGIAVDEMTYGLDLRQALENIAERVDLPDLQFVVISINIQHETGGNLAEILSSLSTVIRDRFRMFKKVRALSGEARISAQLLTFLPFLMGAIIFLIAPTFYLGVLHDPLFLPGIGIALAFMGMGVYAMHRMINFKF